MGRRDILGYLHYLRLDLFPVLVFLNVFHLSFHLVEKSFNIVYLFLNYLCKAIKL